MIRYSACESEGLADCCGSAVIKSCCKGCSTPLQSPVNRREEEKPSLIHLCDKTKKSWDCYTANPIELHETHQQWF